MFFQRKQQTAPEAIEAPAPAVEDMAPTYAPTSLDEGPREYANAAVIDDGFALAIMQSFDLLTQGKPRAAMGVKIGYIFTQLAQSAFNDGITREQFAALVQQIRDGRVRFGSFRYEDSLPYWGIDAHGLIMTIAEYAEKGRI